MLDCRYHGMCCFNEPECPKRKHCLFYSPMPNVKSLRVLADELDTCTVDRLNHLGEADRISGREYARRIREDLGVDDADNRS